jgi:hypothetical protein
VSRARLGAHWIAGLLAICIAGPAGAQGNLDAGKTPAQIFADTCSACHRRPQELKRASAGFLRQHYTPGSAEAAAMASYLARVGSDPRAVEQRRERAKAQAERGKAAQVPGKGRRTAETSKAKTAAAKPPDPPPEPPAERAPPPPKVVLEPFEE